jgi:hypothetical protein
MSAPTQTVRLTNAECQELLLALGRLADEPVAKQLLINIKNQLFTKEQR